MNVCAHQSYTRFKHRVLDRKESWEESGKTMKEIGFPFLMSQEDGMEGTANTHVGWVLSFYSFWWLWSRSMKYNASSRVITSTTDTTLVGYTIYSVSHFDKLWPESCGDELGTGSICLPLDHIWKLQSRICNDHDKIYIQNLQESYIWSYEILFRTLTVVLAPSTYRIILELWLLSKSNINMSNGSNFTTLSWFINSSNYPSLVHQIREPLQGSSSSPVMAQDTMAHLSSQVPY